MDLTEKQKRFYSAGAVARIYRRIYATTGSPFDTVAHIEDMLLKDYPIDGAILFFNSVYSHKTLAEVKSYVAETAYWIKKDWHRVIPAHRTYLRKHLRRFFSHVRSVIRRKRGDILLEL